MEGGPELKKAVEVYERLQKMSCPCLEGVCVTEPQNIQDLLCSPSLHRLDILEWICIRVYPPLQDQFCTLKESQADVKVKEMAKLGFDLMLCGSEDVDLIKGHVSPNRQLSFMGQLLDVICNPTLVSCISDLECSPQVNDKNLASYVRENEELLKEMFSNMHFQQTLSPECNPWPADLKPLLITEEQQKGTLPSCDATVIHEHLETLQQTTSALQELKEQCSFLDCSVLSETIAQSLKLALTDFRQLLAAFTQVYENEFQEHCGHPVPQLSPIGPLFQSVHRLLGICSKELEAIAQFTETSNTIAEVVTKRQQSKEFWGGSTQATLYEMIQEVKQTYELFQSDVLE